MQCWQVRESLGTSFPKPNKDPLLSIESIWPRPSAALAAYFAFVSRSASATTASSPVSPIAAHHHHHHHHVSSVGAYTTTGWNADIGRSLAARQIARCLSVAVQPVKRQKAQDICFSSGDDDDEAFVAAATAISNSDAFLYPQQQAASRASATSQLQLQSPLRSVTNPTGAPVSDFGGEDVLDLPHVALILPSSEIAMIDRDLARVHVFAPNASVQHRALLSAPGQLVAPLGGCVTSGGLLCVCDMVGASVVVVDPMTGLVRVRWLGTRSGVVPEVEMRARVAAFRADFAMPKDALELPLSASPPSTGGLFSSPQSGAQQQQQQQQQLESLSVFSSSAANTVLAVSDYGKNALILLHCGTGNWKKLELGEDVKPGAMCLDPALNLLLVADESRNRIYMLRVSEVAQTAMSLSAAPSSSNSGSSVSANFVGCVDLAEIVGGGIRTGPCGMAPVGDGGVIVSNPGAANVICFSDLTQQGATKSAPKWGAFRNGKHLFAFPSGITLFPYNSFAVVCRNSGFVHFLPTSGGGAV